MNMLVSISSRGLVYIPEKVQNKLIMETLPDIMEFAGTLKSKTAPVDFDFRKYREENYERV